MKQTNPQIPAVEDLDQTFFGEESVVLPSTSVSAEATTAVKPAPPRWIKVLSGLIALLLILAVVGLMLINRSTDKQAQVLATPTPSPSPLVVSELERRFALLQADIELADPGQTELSFPPVDFTLDLQDATVLQEQNRR